MYNLFSTPVFKEKLKNHNSFKKQIINDLEEKFYKVKQKKHWAEYCNSWQETVDLSKYEINNEIETFITQYLCILGCTPFTPKVESWINVHDKNMYQEVHDHIPSIISGIYYISFDKEVDKSAVFLNPNSNFADMCLAQGVELGILTDPKFSFPIEEGDIIIFPSTLKHYVPMSLERKKGLRISLSFNLKKT